MWPVMTSLPDYNKITFDHCDPIPLSEVVPEASSEAVDLISQFLVYNAADRLPAAKVSFALKKFLPSYFQEPDLLKILVCVFKLFSNCFVEVGYT